VTVVGSGGDKASATFTVQAATNPSPTAPQSSPTLAPTQPTTSPTAPSTSGIPTAGTTWFGCTITPEQANDEHYLLTLLNKHRADAGVPLLTLDETLSVASRGHSCDMFVHQHLDHTGSDGSSPYSRMSKVGISYSAAGENIGMAGGYSSTGGVDTIDNDMMGEPLAECAGSPSPCNHHANIVYRGYTHVGIGVIYANNQVWLTEDFTG